MQVRIFGDISVQPTGGVARPVTSPRPRLILAMLASRLGRSVAEDQLVDAIWGATPPTSARTALQTYLSALRDELEPERERRSSGSYIETSPGGYTLRADCCSVDLVDFEQVVAACTASAVATADASMLRRLDDALDSWGEPLAEFGAESWAVGTVARLAERHALALELRAERALHDGDAPNIVDRLRVAVERYPFRERLVEQLMIALYQSGDQQAALAEGAALRRRLLDDLGVDPSPSLLRTERQILEHDDVLSVSTDVPESASSVPPGSPHPTERPAPIVGRTDELANVIDLVGANRVVTLVGPGGIGKTLLAAHVAEQRRHVVDTDIVVDLDDLANTGADDIVRAIAVALGVNEQPGSELITAITDTMRSRSVLLRIDTAEIAPEAAASVVVDLAAAPDVHVLVTSQVPLRCTGERVVRIGGLDVDSAVALLAGRGDGDGDHERAALEAIAEQLEGAPLALELVSGRLDALGAAETLDQLRRGIAPSGGAGRPTRHRSTAAAADWSIDLLDSDERVVMARLAVHAAPFTLRVARHTWGVEPFGSDDIEQLIAGLVDRSLVQRIEGSTWPRYRLLDTVRDAVLARSDNEVLTGNEARLTEVVVDTAQAAMFQTESVVSIDELEGEVTSTLDRLHDLVDGRELVLAGCLALWWAGRGRAAEGSDLLGRALATHRNAPDIVFGPTAGVASLLSYVRGDMHQTRERLALMGERGDSWMVPAVHHTIEASTAFLDRRYDDAAKHYEETLLHYDEPTGSKLLMVWLGANSLWYAGHLHDAQEQYQRLRREAATVDDYNVATALRFEAMVTAALGDVERAWRLAERSLVASTALGDGASRGQAEVAVAVVAHALNDGETAERHALLAIDATLGPFDLFTQRAAPVLVAAQRLECGDSESAALALGWYLDYLDRTGQPPAVATAALAGAVEAGARETLGRSVFARTAAGGAALRLRELLDALRA